MRPFFAEFYHFVEHANLAPEEKYRLFADLFCKDLIKVDKAKFTGIDRNFKARNDLLAIPLEIDHYLGSIETSLTEFHTDLVDGNVKMELS
jgi:hypothetical protein